jgi:CubicO group peptidase (beta-lactamase class C family)
MTGIGRSTLLALVACISLACGSATGVENANTEVPTPWEVRATDRIDDGSTYWPASQWRTALPAQVGMEPTAMAALSRDLRSGRWPTIRSLVVVRQGFVVFNEYLAGTTPERLQSIQSVTKTVTGLLVGIAQRDGKLRVSDTVSRLFPQYADLFAGNADKQAITIDDLLTMRSGLDFYEEPYEGSPLQALNNSTGDWLRLIFGRPMVAHPGDVWRYNSGGVIALGGVLFETTGIAADAYAARELFTPLGITRTSWFRGQPNGLPHMGGGLSLTSPDLARIGYLLLRGGRWNGTVLVPESWVSSMRERHTRQVGAWLGTYSLDYGRMLWLLPPVGGPGAPPAADVITASGSGGQWIFVVPSKDLVVVATGAAVTFEQFAQPIRLLYDVIVPATL